MEALMNKFTGKSNTYFFSWGYFYFSAGYFYCEQNRLKSSAIV